MGGYDLQFWFRDLINGNESAPSSYYPIDKTECMTISLANLAEGDLIETMVHADAGVTKNGDTAIIYHASPAITATFTCNGTTLNFQCTLNGEAYLSELAANGVEIPISYLLY